MSCLYARSKYRNVWSFMPNCRHHDLLQTKAHEFKDEYLFFRFSFDAVDVSVTHTTPTTIRTAATLTTIIYTTMLLISL